MTTATLRNVGNSVAVVIPKQWLSVLGLAAGTKVELSLEEGRLTLEPQQNNTRKRYTLAELLAECDADGASSEELEQWEQAPAVGNEVW